jgi:tellurite methyltransferase
MTHSIEFFDAQFRKQVAAGDFAFNPFEKAALPFVSGRVLDLGCGLGNLSVEAARRGAVVTAVDASAAAIERLRKTALAENLKITPVLSDLESYSISGRFDTVVAIGLLMFFARPKALSLLAGIQEHVAAGGVAVVNVLVEGTTYMGMFEPGRYCLFGRNELEERFAGWEILLSTRDSFDAPGNTKKEFATLVARKNR